VNEKRLCVWAENEDGWWNTGCDNIFAFEHDGPSENGAKFCLYCGAELVPMKYEEPTREEES